jgi:hypothetical protein
MVQAILEGRKTQTRRTKKLEKINQYPDNWYFIGTNDPGTLFFFKNRISQEEVIMFCPYGAKGNLLWVRESFYEPLFEALNGKYYYKADLEKQGWDFKWKPSIHMPKEACRIFLRIKNVRVERLNSITGKDAICEGIEFAKTKGVTSLFKDYTKNKEYFFAPGNSFMSLWASINGKESWLSNPYVWVIEFERIDKPENF